MKRGFAQVRKAATRQEMTSLETETAMEMDRILGGASTLSFAQHSQLILNPPSNLVEMTSIANSGSHQNLGSDPNWAQIAKSDEASAHAAEQSGNYAEAAQDFDGAAGAYTHLGQTAQAASAFNSAGQYYVYSGNAQAAASAYSNSANDFATMGNMSAAATASENAGMAYSMNGQNSQSASAYETAGSDYEAAGQLKNAASSYINAANEGGANEYQDYMNAASIYANKLGDASDAASAYSQAANDAVASLSERCSAALSAEQLYGTLGETNSEASNAALAGSLLYQMGDYVKSGHQYDLAAELTASVGGNTANYYAAAGQSFAQGNDFADAGRAYFHEAKIERADGHLNDAAQIFDLAANDAERGGANMTSGRAFLDEGILYQELGHLNAALSAERKSVDVYSYVLGQSSDNLQAIEGQAKAYATEATILSKQGNVEMGGMMDMAAGKDYGTAAALGTGDTKQLWQDAASVYLSAKLDFTSTGDYVQEAVAEQNYENAEQNASN